MLGFFCVIGTGMIKAYRLFQALSLDVALGAVVLSTAMAKYLGTELTWAVQLSLFICVWLIYSFDHLMDSDKQISPSVSLRHYIHYRFRRGVICGMVAAILMGVITLFYLPSIVILWGVTATAFIIIYFLLVRYTRFWAKEVFVALGYTAGVFLAPLSLTVELMIPDVILLMTVIFLLAVVNLLTFSFFDFEMDQQVGFHSMAVRFGKRTIRKTILGLAFLSMALTMVLYSLEQAPSLYAMIVLMNLSLIALILKPSFFREDQFYRVIGDGIFFFPLFYLLYA